jgi:anti-sigma B factor antagonist
VSAPLAEVSIENDGDLVIASVSGEVDLSNSGDVGEAIRRGVPASNTLVIDLAPVEYLDSAAIAMLDGLRESGVSAHLVAPRESPARRLLTMVELGLPLHETRADAARELRAGRSG